MNNYNIRINAVAMQYASGQISKTEAIKKAFEIVKVYAADHYIYLTANDKRKIRYKLDMYLDRKRNSYATRKKTAKNGEK